jgi:hypothetical protein
MIKEGKIKYSDNLEVINGDLRVQIPWGRGLLN